MTPKWREMIASRTSTTNGSQQVCEEQEVAYGLRNPDGITPDSLRKSFAGDSRRAGVGRSTMSELAGWKPGSAVIDRHYDVQSATDKWNAMAALADRRGKARDALEAGETLSTRTHGDYPQ